MTDPARPAQSLWMRDDGGIAPQERLRRTVAALTRARRAQLLLDHAFAGLAAGLALAAVVVLVARLASPPLATWQLVAAVVAGALAVALGLGWHRRPAALDVAIRADVALRLKQRLSTAWEYMSAHDDPAAAERLAAQAVKARLPARAQTVFPLRFNRWARFAPIAAIALMLVSVLDVSRMQLPSPRPVDERIVEEGQRLRAVARELKARAAREKLAETAAQAEELERLGARMEAGAISRSEALAQLRRMRKSLDAAAAKARDTQSNSAGAASPGAEQGAALAQGQSVAQMLDRLLRGVPPAQDARALGRYLDELAQAGVPRQKAEEGLKRYQAGDQEGLRELLAQAAQVERARQEQELMYGTSEQLRRMQESLAESYALARDGSGTPSAAHDDEGEGEESDRASNDGADKRRFGEASRGASRFGKQGDSSIAAERSRGPVAADGAKGPILKPQSQSRGGEELVTQGQVLPRAGRANVEESAVSAQFAPQIEALLSREQYPAHSKEFIRRYFLSLSQGTGDPQQRSRGGE